MRNIVIKIQPGLVFLLCLTFICASCKSVSRSEKYYEKQEQKLALEEEKAYQSKVKEHNKMQSEQTLKMMRDAERQAKKLNKSRKR